MEAIKANPLDPQWMCTSWTKYAYDNNSYETVYNTYFDSAGEIATAIMVVMWNLECSIQVNASLVEAGELKALAVFATERMGPPFEDVPTFTEMGHSDLVLR